MKKIFFSRFVVFCMGGAVLLGMLTASLVIYLTPLKWVTLVQPKIKDIEPTQFWADYQKNPSKYLLLDVRDVTTYNNAHAKGAMSEPIANLLNDNTVLPKSGKKIVLICSSGRLAGVAYGYLEHQGFFNLLRIEGGLNAWKAAGLPVEGNAALIPKRD